MIRLEISGRVAPKKNSRKMRVNYRYGYHYTVPGDRFEAYKESFLEQVAKQYDGAPIKPPYYVEYTFFMRGMGATDGDNMEGSINDLLQDAAIIEDDKQIIEWHGKKVLKAKEYVTIVKIWETKEREDNEAKT